MLRNLKSTEVDGLRVEMDNDEIRIYRGDDEDTVRWRGVKNLRHLIQSTELLESVEELEELYPGDPHWALEASVQDLIGYNKHSHEVLSDIAYHFQFGNHTEDMPDHLKSAREYLRKNNLVYICQCTSEHFPDESFGKCSITGIRGNLTRVLLEEVVK
jgi:hypothetical protein